MNLTQGREYLTQHLRNRYFAVGDVLLLILATYVSYVLRLERPDIDRFWPGFFLYSGVAVVVALVVYWRAGIYSRYWHYASIEEMFLLAVATGLAGLLTGVLAQLLDRWLLGD